MSKDGTVKIKEVISISKKKILKKYQDMDKYFRDIIEALYAGKYESFEMKNTVKQTKNDYSKLKSESLRDKTGCYIFLCNRRPVYVGVGGIRKSQDLVDRIKQECRSYVKKDYSGICNYSKDSGATLSKKIQDEEKVSPNESMEKIKTFDLIPIVVGEITKEKDVVKAKALETILIAIFHPKYNK